MTYFQSQRHLVAINDSLVHEYQRGDEIWVQVDGDMQLHAVEQCYFVDLTEPVVAVRVNGIKHQFTEQTVREWQSSYSMIA